ncbi:RdRP-domain-containing protein [Wolfiporia cocos MD-104 SS10]|uniref:RNA-dependent RNA polymerase n=1 Tax=Wolfiporia cocos (strain MD-104) TaxID=742152 RepID=A0A2H3J479_WOLCO|nr:RdRP-domain-containing protein [Wolfiporia cocos MD-104 SS10]
MEIFMRNISFSADEHQLKIYIANVLHSPDYTPPTEPPPNFDVRIKPRNKTIGTLTFPSIELGTRFLGEFGGPQPTRMVFIGSRIYFSYSRKNPNPGVLETIRRLPYVDPRAEQEDENRSRELRSMAVNLVSLQFGWLCRDDVFSVEWEKQCVGQGTLIFDDNRREFRIRVREGDDVRMVVITAAQIYFTGATLEQEIPVIFLHLNHPPSFESESEHSQLITEFASLLIPNAAAPPSRQRWSSFDDDHSSLSPFTSLAIRLICAEHNDLSTYRRFCDIAQTRVATFAYPIARRGLFSPDVRDAYRTWVQQLEWCVAFQVEAISLSNVVHMKELLKLRPRIQRLIAAWGSTRTSDFLCDFHSRLKAQLWYDDSEEVTQDAVQKLFQAALRDFHTNTLTTIRSSSADNFDCLHVVITPTTMSLEGPFPDRSNRVIRRYMENQDCFLRVSFVDETRLTYRFDREVDLRSFVNRRVKGFLLNGLDIAGRHFDFLAYSQSALKEHAVWFVKPFTDPSTGRRVDASSIIQSLGSFQNLAFDRELIYCPARYAARISQAFTATDSSITVEAEEVSIIDDVYDAMGRHCFTDGVGTISPELAKEIWRELRAKRRRARRGRTYPRCLQIRFMGSKGMLSVDYRLRGREICIRNSMLKFDAPNSLEVEIAQSFDKPGKYFLNRPLIMLLEGLGVPADVFLMLQEQAVRETQAAMNSLETAARLLEAHGLGASFRLSSTMLGLHKLGLAPFLEDIFWRQMMDFAVNHVLRELKHHARIPVPGGWTLVGVADVHGWLQEGEIFACIDPQDHSGLIYLEGPTLISRSPTIHPGDVQVVHAIGRPPPGSPFERESLRNSVVFSIHGDRPLPSYLGGGDLDGDTYNLTTLPSLRPQRLHEPASYEPAKKKLVDHPSTMADVADFIAEFITSDTLGIIAITWLIIADQSTQGILDPDCLRLSKLHSDAVDYPKSGSPVPLQQIPKLKFKAKPDWNAPETISSKAKGYYKSERAIGQLFRAIDLPALSTAARASRFQRRQMQDGHELSLEDVLAEFRSSEPHYDNIMQLEVEHRIAEFTPLPDIEDVDDDNITRMWKLLESYASRLRAICADHSLSHSRSAMLTEEEAVIGTIVAKCSQPRKRKDTMSHLREQTSNLVSAVRAEISGDDDTPSEDSLIQAWMAYKVALIVGDYFGARSFEWIALGEIFNTIRDIEEEDRKLFR